MLKRIVWSEKADKERIKILIYWIKRNKSNTYSTKLNLSFKKSLQTIAKSKESGKPTDLVFYKNKNIRCIFDILPHPTKSYRSFNHLG